MNAVTETAAIYESRAICAALADGGYSVKLRGFNAIDQYMGLPALPCFWVETDADISALARCIENLRFPGVETADAAVDAADGTCYFRCLDREDQNSHDHPAACKGPGDQTGNPFPPLSFACNLRTGRFEDPAGVYPLLRELRDNKKRFLEDGASPFPDVDFGHDHLFPIGQAGKNYRAIMDASLLLARYGYWAGASGAPADTAGLSEDHRNDSGPLPGPEAQRAFLCCLLVSPRPDLGLELLKRSGFLDELWPELACFDDVDHSKEFHPEGNVWIHTLETFRHRKPAAGGAYDLRLSLGLLLHDAGKPAAASHGSRRFDGHAELGAETAACFLERLEFDPSLVQDVYFLVRNHMLPAALKRRPLAKTKEIMASPLFPILMELYRCDESSSFKGLDGYYENSAAYQTFLKNIRNPYRSADGKKMRRREIY